MAPPAVAVTVNAADSLAGIEARATISKGRVTWVAERLRDQFR
jgi:hypothetical protein